MNLMLYIVGALTLIAAVNVVFSKQTIYSALSLVIAVGLLAVMFLLLNAQFLFVVQIIIYAGAVMVLFVFIIALLSPTDEDRPRFDWRMAVGLCSVLVLTGGVLLLATNGITFHGTDFRGAQIGGPGNPQSDPYSSFAFNYVDVNNRGNIQTVAGQLFTTHVLAFEITSLLLLVAVIGAVYLTRTHRSQNS